MEYNLLRMTQLILSSMDSDEVNSIDDTVESQQVVDIIETTFNDLVSSIDFPSDWDLTRLTNFGDATRPTLMTIPSNVAKIGWVKYNNAEDGDTTRNFVEVKPMSRFAFFERMNSLDTADSNIYQFDYEVGNQTFDVRGHNDAFPSYYTTVNNDTLIFDNYHSTYDTTLAGGKTQVFANIVPTFSRTDVFVAPLDNKHFTILFNEAKSSCWADLKQAQNAKAEQRARRGWVNVSRDKSRVPERPAIYDTPNFGRGGRGSRQFSLPPKATRGW